MILIKSENIMEKEKIIHLATNLYEEAFCANSYWLLIQQIQKNTKTYNNEMSVSPCFYNLIYNSLIKSMLMELSKLYDSNGISLTNLLDEINPNKAQNAVMVTICDNTITHVVCEFDKWYFKNEVDKLNRMCESLNLKSRYPTVEMKYSDYYEYLKKQFKSISKSNDKLREQRNNFLAHNGEGYNFNFKKLNIDFPVNKNDIDKLLEYAFTITTFVIEVLTGVSKPRTSVDINDWKKTLKLVHEGRDYIEKVDN